MNLKPQLYLWAPFAISSVLTSLVYTTLWAFGWYWILLTLLGILSGILAARIFLRTGLRRSSVVGVAFGLVVGQWWFIEFVAMQMLWRIRGFAP
jgi:hypothetical protein